MKVLVACEFSGVVRDEFARIGHDSWSCDIEPTERPGQHIQDDVRNVLNEGWDLIIAHPPCTYLTVTGGRWFYHPDDRHLEREKRRPHPLYPNRAADREKAIQFFMDLYNAPADMVAIENPVGVMSKRFRKPDQIVRPCEHGEGSTKKTCLWLRGLPRLKPTHIVKPEIWVTSTGKRFDRWYWETSLISDLKERTRVRSRTFIGIARAMASQWGRQG